MPMLTHVSLFSGIGGFDIAALMSGFTNCADVEINEFCRSILKLRFPESKLYNDIHDVSGSDLLNDANGHITVLTGGFPCQPISIAGERKGCQDDRWLWPEFDRIIGETKPDWVIIENSPRLYSIPEYLWIKNDLENKGYEVLQLCIPASGIGAPHERERAFVVASLLDGGRKIVQSYEQSCVGEEVSPNPDSDRLQTLDSEQVPDRKAFPRNCNFSGETIRRWRFPWQENPPSICRMDDGFSKGLDKSRLQALGNAVVPQVVFPIFEGIKKCYHT